MIRRGVRVGTYLLWLVLAVTIPLLTFTIATLWRVEQAQRLQQEAALRDQARDAAQAVDQEFERVLNSLVALSASSALANADISGFEREAPLLYDRSHQLPFELTAPDGRELLQIGSGSTPERDNDPLRQVAQMAASTGSSIVTGLLRPNDPSRREVGFAVPVFRLGEAATAYVLVATLDAPRLTSLIQVTTTRPADLALVLRDREGVTIARYPDTQHDIGMPAPPGFFAALAGRSSGLIRNDAYAGKSNSICAFTTTRVGSYTVSATLPMEAFDALVRQDLIETGLIGAALLAAGLLTGAYFARRLVDALTALGHGNPAAASMGLREVAELAGRLQAVTQERDITEAALRDNEAHLQELVGTLDLAPIMVREFEGTIRFWSHGCACMYGWSADEAVGRSSHELLRTQFPVLLSQIEQTLLASGEWHGDLVHRRRDGTPIISAVHKVLRRDPNTQPGMVMESLVDITAFREAQNALLTLNQQLEQRVLEEVAAHEVAQQRAAHADRIQALGQLAGGIAHDFNNVLQAVAGGAALIARRPEDADGVARLIQLIRDAATRGASITRRMLLLARRGDLKAEPIDVHALLVGMREVFVHTLGVAIEVEVEAIEVLPHLLADKAQLETALVNLATNARDAMPRGGTLRLLAASDVICSDEGEHPAGLAPGCYIRLSVADDGTGMTQATLARVGEPFFTTKEVGKGTGLGLSMVKGFAEQSGGGFVITSVMGVGTTATLWMPSVAAEANNAGREILRRTGLSGRILLVDDDKLVRDTLMEQLEELGHKVLAASGGTDALSILRAREAVDLMITDLSMPGMDGLMLIREAHDLRPSLPTILLTGYAGDAAALEYSGVGKETYTLMRKPTTSATLGARVTALLER